MSHNFHDADDLDNCRSNLEANGYRVLSPNDLDAIESSITKLQALVQELPTEVVTRLIAEQKIREYLNRCDSSLQEVTWPLASKDWGTIVETSPQKARSSDCPTCFGDGVLSRQTEDGIEESICPTCKGTGATEPTLERPERRSRLGVSNDVLTGEGFLNKQWEDEFDTGGSVQELEEAFTNEELVREEERQYREDAVEEQAKGRRV